MSHRDLITCDIGDRVLITGTLADSAGDPVSGATVTARSLHDGTEADLGTCTDNSDGTYSVELEPDAAGKWEIRFDSADPELAAEEGIVWVRSTGFSTT